MSRQSRHRGVCARVKAELGQVDAVWGRFSRALELRGGDATFAVELLLREFLNNAILHARGTGGRRIRVSLRGRPSGMVLRVTDPGRGFDWRRLQSAVPSAEDTTGRGVVIGKLYARRVGYNQRGNSVTLWVKWAPTRGDDK